jgi:hypothetical protein
MQNVLCSMLRKIMKKCRTKRSPPPTDDQIKKASKDVAWEYVAMLAAAREMANGHVPGEPIEEAFLTSPINSLIQDAFLVHARNLAEFFHEGVEAFKKAPGPPPRRNDNIYAVDFCRSVSWQSEPFDRNKKLIKAINKTLSHMTYSRARTSKNRAFFEGAEHVHGTVQLISRTWGNFIISVRPELLQPQCAEDIHFWLAEHTKGWPVKFSDLEREFEAHAQQRVLDCKWELNRTPDGLV